eukprot:jgi/Mesvir1/16604/Mv10138-RA.1
MTLGLIALNCPVARNLTRAGMYRPSISKSHFCEVDADIDDSRDLLELHSFRFRVPHDSHPSDDDMRAVNMLFAILRGRYPRDHVTIVNFEDHSTLYGKAYIVTSDDSNGPMPFDDFRAQSTLVTSELRERRTEKEVVYEYP